MRIAVSAASGRLGHATIRALQNEQSDDRIVAIARDTKRIEADGVEKRAGDYTDPAQMQTALEGVDTLVMISAPVAGGGDRLVMHQQVIAAAKAAGVRKLIYTSVIGNGEEAGTHFAEFAQINRATEAAVQASGLEWVIARNGLYLDLDLNHIRAAEAADGVYSNNGGDGRCGYISIAELGYGAARLARSDACNGKVINLIGETHTQAELVEMANDAFGLSVRYEPITLAANVERFRSIPGIAARGDDVINMLTGCFECIEKGAFDVESDFLAATGRQALPVREQMDQLR